MLFSVSAQGGSLRIHFLGNVFKAKQFFPVLSSEVSAKVKTTGNIFCNRQILICFLKGKVSCKIDPPLLPAKDRDKGRFLQYNLATNGLDKSTF